MLHGVQTEYHDGRGGGGGGGKRGRSREKGCSERKGKGGKSTIKEGRRENEEKVGEDQKGGKNDEPSRGIHVYNQSTRIKIEDQSRGITNENHGGGIVFDDGGEAVLQVKRLNYEELRRRLENRETMKKMMGNWEKKLLEEKTLKNDYVNYKKQVMRNSPGHLWMGGAGSMEDGWSEKVVDGLVGKTDEEKWRKMVEERIKSNRRNAERENSGEKVLKGKEPCLTFKEKEVRHNGEDAGRQKDTGEEEEKVRLDGVETKCEWKKEGRKRSEEGNRRIGSSPSSSSKQRRRQNCGRREASSVDRQFSRLILHSNNNNNRDNHRSPSNDPNNQSNLSHGRPKESQNDPTLVNIRNFFLFMIHVHVLVD